MKSFLYLFIFFLLYLFKFSSQSNNKLHASFCFIVYASLHSGIPFQGTSTEWTNEKHRLYIDSLETSFVNKLYHSMRLRDCHPQMNVQETHSSQKLPFKTYNSSDQVRKSKLLYNCWLCERVCLLVIFIHFPDSSISYLLELSAVHHCSR